MNFKLSSRDLKFFIFGALAAFIFVIIYDWEEFEKGFRGGTPDTLAKIERTK